ncbi:MAG: competence/damage-inducible protein A [Sandaracinaceae bacterium]|nr:MAG: competence/damage-inducible protein A [Sandaracinaceae bacterium]HBQ12028.1 competence/damage-inducible protein A [Myxococcales bacterium]
MARRAAALVIGNEILTGKIRDENVHVLAKELRLLGIVLDRVIICPDDIDVIADDLRALRRSHDLVFTSGGVGPTPDDVTLPAVAKSFDRPLVRSETIEGLIRGYWKDKVTPGHLRMADVPEGADLLSNPEVPWPVVTIDNVCVLPGVPEIFRLKLRMLREKIGSDTPFVSRALYTTCDEGSIAQLLEDLGRHHPAVEIGSYPRWRDDDYRVKLTFDGLDAAAVGACLEACRAALDDEQVVRVE